MFRFVAALIIASAIFPGRVALAAGASKSESKRWTLQEWLEQRDRNRMMDLWLSMNSSSPYEFSLEGSHKGYDQEIAGSAPTHRTSYAVAFSGYAQIVGLTAEYENNSEENYNDLNGLFNLRLFGDSIQNSYLAVHYGIRSRTSSQPSFRFSQPFSQVSLQLYALKTFGIDGLYRIYYSADVSGASTQGTSTSGNLAEAGAFIDFKNFRFFGSWYKENSTDKSSSGETSATKTGIKSGIKIFF